MRHRHHHYSLRRREDGFRASQGGVAARVHAFAAFDGTRIRCLRRLPCERVNIVFATETESEKAEEQPGWPHIAMLEASVKSEAW